VSGQAPPGGGSGSGHDDDPFAVRPATDADRERPNRPLAPIGWGRSAGPEPVPASREEERPEDAAEADDAGTDDDSAAIAAAQEEGIDPAPAEASQAPADDILAGIAPLDATEDADRIAPLDQADASADGDPDGEAAPVPEPEIAAAPVIADDAELTDAPADLPAAGSADFPSSDAPLTGEVLTDEVEADPVPVDDATAELVLEPIATDDDLRLPEPAADGAVGSAVVDAELVEEPEPETPAEPSDDDLVDLTPRVDAGLDEDAGVVDDPVDAPDAPGATAPAELEAGAAEVEIARPADASADPSAVIAADEDAERGDPDASPAPLAPAASAGRAAAMAWAAGSPVAATPLAAPAPAAPDAVPSAPVASAAVADEDRPADVGAEPAGSSSDPASVARDEPAATAAFAAASADAAPEAPPAPAAPPAPRPGDPSGPAADRDAPVPPAVEGRDRADRVASDDQPVDAIALLFGDAVDDADDQDAALDADGDRRSAEPDRPAPDGDADRTRILPAGGAAAGVAAAGAAAPAAQPDRDASTAAVPASARADAASAWAPGPDGASGSAPVPSPYAAPPAPRPPAPRAPARDAARVPAPPAAPPRGATGARGPRGPRRTALWVGGAIVLVLLLIGLFFVGQRLVSPAEPDAAPVATATAAEETPTPSPTPTDPVQGPAAAGVQAWDALLGGECLEPYTTPWEEEFTVVDCGSEHHAQMVARVALPQTGDTFPGEDAVRDSADELCIADTVIDYGAARAYEDVQYQSAYPITQDEWTAGDRDAYCFVSRAGGGTFTGSIGVPQPPVVP